MIDWLQQATAEANALTVAEVAAFILGVAYLLFAIREMILCWICALLSTLIFTFVFARSLLYMDAALQLFYAVMAVYGWWSWRAGRPGKPTMAVCRWPASLHAAALTIVLAVSALAGWLLDHYTNAMFPYVDSATTFASLWATFLVARKVLENWWYWLVIDAVSIVIYVERGLAFAATLFAVYLVLIPFGLIAWTRSYRASRERQALQPA